MLTAACSSPIEPTPTPGTLTLTCPADVTLQSLDGSKLTVTYPPPTSAGGSAPVAIACAPPSGSGFSPGVSVVSCNAKDASSRAATCSFSVRISVPPKLRATRFMAFGDSMTEGKVSTLGPLFKLTDFPGSYPSDLLALMLARYTGQAVTMSKQGLGSEATSTGLIRLQGLLASERPEVLLLMDGANDLFGGDPATVAPAASNMDQMVVLAKGAGATVYLATLPPQVQGGLRAKGYLLVGPYNTLLKSIASTRGATLVDVYPVLATDPAAYISPDGLHPSQAGYQKIADTFFAAIRATLEIPGVLTSDVATAPLPGRIVPETAGETRTPARAGARSPARRPGR